MKRRIALAGAGCVALVPLLLGSAAAAAHPQPQPLAADCEAYLTIRGVDTPAPDRYDEVHVLRVGSPAARQVLVLVPAGIAGANDFRPLAHDLVRADPHLQVWAVDRREQNLADLSRMDQPDASYYLDGRYRRVDAPWATGWGLAVGIGDLHAVVDAARDHGRRQVVLGGHSWGATTALSYAAWDFDGRPGYADIAGLVLIDGGVHDAWAGEGYHYRVTAEEARAGLASTTPFSAKFSRYLGFGDRPETQAIWYQLIARKAAVDPTGPSTLAADLPIALRPPRPVTNRGLLGWVMDSGAPFPGLQVTSGHLDEAGDWVNTGPTPIERVAMSLGGPTPNGLEWYWPNRLDLDLQAADAYGDVYADPEVDRLLGLRQLHTRELNIPMYVFQTGLDGGSIETAARWVEANSRIPRATYVTDATMRHVDPLLATPERNPFTQTVAPFLTGLHG